MQIQIRWSELDKSDALAAHVDDQVKHAIRHFSELFTRIDVHLHDDNAHRTGGNDKRCVIEARPKGSDPLIVEGTGDDFYKLVSATCKKLERASRHHIDRHRTH